MHRIGALAGLALQRRQFDGGQQADVADVDHVRQALQAVRRVFPVVPQFAAALEKAVALADFQRRQACRAGHRMPGIGVSVRELDGAFRALHEGIVDVLLHQRRAHRDGAVRQALGAGDDVRLDAEVRRGKRAIDAAEGADHFIEYQQDAVRVADLAQLLQVALGRNDHAGGSGHRLHDDGGDRRRVMQGDDALQRVGQMGSPIGLPARIGHLVAVVGVGQVVHVRQQIAEGLAVACDAGHRQAAEAHAVVGAFPSDQPDPLALASRAVVAQRDLQCGVHRLRPRV
ncbi:hypothetical protein D3C72_1474460 [compost metagenome]